MPKNELYGRAMNENSGKATALRCRDDGAIQKELLKSSPLSGVGTAVFLT